MPQDLPNLHPDVQEFVDCLQRIQSLLSAHHENFWQPRIQKVIQVAQKSDGYSIELFLGFFGGMGSLNDLVLNGSSAANSALHDELKNAYKIAKKLR